MNGKDAPDKDEGSEEVGHEAEPHQGRGTSYDLSSFMESVRQISAWQDEMLDITQCHIKEIDSTRQIIKNIMGPSKTAIQAAPTTQRRYTKDQ
ncbi:hypothetical protein PZB75_30625 (plasmid) [Streptomyces sp. AM 4-1-1]|uniref:hypothetical protein n=1 Tax=Streptomyces sp. AM 4-1-1 TaxID=3028710 RepID=UPI0023B93179|nr:hypothetical protein [Streptomyces sp. AM 4-1-1]WEH37760.1 hypothetical protein PZB75_30625 [Streptomyces sp. AM 4-1-1]